MIICCHSEIARQWDEEELTATLSLLPPELREAALRKRRLIDKQLYIEGKFLMYAVMRALTEDDHSFQELKYNTHKRPYFDNAPDFNISHSGNRVICCGTDKGKIGIDIEQIKKINLADYPDYFTRNEWNYINGYKDKFEGFYNLWTRKEAVLKTIGTGFYTPLSSVDVVADSIEYDHIVYHIQPLHIAADYICHIASTVKDKVKLMAIEL